MPEPEGLELYNNAERKLFITAVNMGPVDLE